MVEELGGHSIFYSAASNELGDGWWTKGCDNDVVSILETERLGRKRGVLITQATVW
jgi:hypothetical protein